MTMNTLGQAALAWMWQDMARSADLGARRRQAHSALYREAQALAEGLPDGIPLTPFQTKMQALVDELTGAVEGVFQALDRPFHPDRVEDDPAALAAVTITGVMAGRLLDLELRLRALKAASS